jgi:hypothetical protein
MIQEGEPLFQEYGAESPEDSGGATVQNPCKIHWNCLPGRDDRHASPESGVNAIIAYNVMAENGRSMSVFFFKEAVRDVRKEGKKRNKTSTAAGMSVSAPHRQGRPFRKKGYFENGSIFRRSDIQRMARESDQRFDGLSMRSRETARRTTVTHMKTV